MPISAPFLSLITQRSPKQNAPSPAARHPPSPAPALASHLPYHSLARRRGAECLRRIFALLGEGAFSSGPACSRPTPALVAPLLPDAGPRRPICLGRRPRQAAWGLQPQTPLTACTERLNSLSKTNVAVSCPAPFVPRSPTPNA